MHIIIIILEFVEEVNGYWNIDNNWTLSLILHILKIKLAYETNLVIIDLSNLF